MPPRSNVLPTAVRRTSPAAVAISLSLHVALLSAVACATATSSSSGNVSPSRSGSIPDPRVGLRAGKTDAAEIGWNIRRVSTTPPPEKFGETMNSDLAFTRHYAIQGNFNGYQVWDISNPRQPTLTTSYYCPGSQSDVSVYKNLLFVSGENLASRLDCGAEGVQDTVSKARLRGVRIFDITDISKPKNVGNVQTCRGSHTHTVVEDPRDAQNIYIYISGSGSVRSPNEMPGCSALTPDKDPNSSLFRIEVIKVPLAHPEQAAIVASPRIFQDLVAPARHGDSPEDIIAAKKAADSARAAGGYTLVIGGSEMVAPSGFIKEQLDEMVKARGGTGAPTAADSAKLRVEIQGIVSKMVGEAPGSGPRPGPTQCHDITVYPGIGLAGGACGGYGLLLDIRNPANPVRIAAAADSNFSYWHSATFNNDGTKVLFSDEWGGGGQPKCRATDKPEWGADAIFTIVDGKMQFKSYYKLPAAQTKEENCVAHNGSLIPIPGRDVMVQGWYQGGISVFDWTDAARPKEIAYFDRGPIDSTRMVMGGSWSSYWYNGIIVSSEIARGLDIFELTPSPYISQNEIDAAKTVVFDHLNAQGQPKLVWPPSFALARAYVDQLERSKGLSASRVTAVRNALTNAERAAGAQRKAALSQLATELAGDANGSSDSAKVQTLTAAVRDLAAAAS